MRKFLLYFLAAFVLTSCDNLIKKKEDKEEETKETSKKLKKPLEDDEESQDDETPKKKKKESLEDEDEDTKTVKRNKDNDDDENSTDYSSGWSKKEKDKFLDDCVTTATNNVGRTRAEEYCSCMLGKIEKKYSNYNEANTQMSKTELNRMAAECNSQ